MINLSLLQNLSSASVLVVGDVMLDRYIHGTVERITPRRPSRSCATLHHMRNQTYMRRYSAQTPVNKNAAQFQLTFRPDPSLSKSSNFTM